MSNEAYQRALEAQRGVTTDNDADGLIPEKNAVPLLVSSPYSNEPGTFHRDAKWGAYILPAVDYATIENLTHSTIDLFASNLDSLGITVLRAEGYRYKNDFDRNEDSYNPALGVRLLPTMKMPENDVYAAHGMGVVWQRIAGDVETPLYLDDNEPTEAQCAAQLIAYREYHSDLKKLINAHMDRFGGSYHISLQPFSKAEAVMLGADPANIPQFVLCDNSGQTSGEEMVAKLGHVIQSKGYITAKNTIFPTGELTKRFASPATGAHSVQLKIYEGLYWDADKVERAPGFSKTSKDLHAIFASMAQFAEQNIKRKPEDKLVILSDRQPQIKIVEP